MYKGQSTNSILYDYPEYMGGFQSYSNSEQEKLNFLDVPITEDDKLFAEVQKMQPKQNKLKELWLKKQYIGYGIYLQYGGYIYEGIFNNNYINGYGLYITPQGLIKKGMYDNFIPKGTGDIYTNVEGRLAFVLHRRRIDKNCFIGEYAIKTNCI